MSELIEVVGTAVTIEVVGGPAEVVTVVEQGPQGRDGDAATGEALDGHIADTTPHPAYDDLPALTLIFENGLV